MSPLPSFPQPALPMRSAATGRSRTVCTGCSTLPSATINAGYEPATVQKIWPWSDTSPSILFAMSRISKPIITLMLLASAVSAAMLVLIPWDSVLSEVTPLRMAFAGLISVFMPVPIALDVMFAAQLHQQGVASGYVMLFAMTLGTYSIIPTIYLWREVSKPLAASLFVFFLGVGWLLGMVF